MLRNAHQTMSFKDINLKEIERKPVSPEHPSIIIFRQRKKYFCTLKENMMRIRELCEAMESEETMTDDQIADVLARTLDNHRQLFEDYVL